MLESSPVDVLSAQHLKDLYGERGGGYANPGFGDTRTRSIYDNNGRVRVQQTDDGQFNRVSDVLYEGVGTASVVIGAVNSTVSTTSPQGQANGYDAAGNVLQYTVRDYRDSQRLSTYRMDYAKRERMLQTKTSGWRNATSTQDTPVVTQQVYDGNGNLREVKNPNNAADAITRSYVTDINGTVLMAYQATGGSDPTPNQFFQLVANGQVLGRYGEMVKAGAAPSSTFVPFEGRKDFNFVYQPVGDRYPATAPSSYTVSAGDTLQAIAKAVWGDPGQWYLIAEANGLADDSGLTVGQVLRIPNRATGGTNSDRSFKPYDPSAVVGDTAPVLPMPPAAKKGCGGFGQIVMIVVAVVVSVYSVGVLSGFSGGFVATMQAGLGVMGVGASLGAGAAGAFGAAGSVLGTVGTLAAGAAIGSAASQLVGMAIGAQDKFSWKQVGLAAIGGGVSGALQGNLLSTTAGSMSNTVLRATLSSALTQGIGVATGLQSSFSWRAVAASAISAGVTKGVGAYLGGGADWQNNANLSNFSKFAIDAGSQFVGGTVAQAVTAKGGKINVGMIAADAFGNALANSILGQINQASQQEQRAGFSRAGADAMDAEYGIYGQQDGWARESALRRQEDMRDAEMWRLMGGGAAAGDGFDFKRASAEANALRAQQEASQASFRQMERDYRQATDTGAVIRRGDNLERLAGYSKEMMGRYASGMGLRNMNELPVGQAMVANWNMSSGQAVARANQFYYTDGLQKTAASLVPAGTGGTFGNPLLGGFIGAGSGYDLSGLTFGGGAPVETRWNMRDAYAASRGQAAPSSFGYGWNGGDRSVLDRVDVTFGEKAGRAFGETWSGFKQGSINLYNTMTGLNSFNQAGANWRAGNYWAAGAYTVVGATEATATLLTFGTGSTTRATAQTAQELAAARATYVEVGSTGSAGAVGRQFVTSDPGVGDIIAAIEARAPGAVKQAEINIYRPDGTTYTDFDIVTDTHVIQVKVGGGKGIVPQIQTSQQLTDLPVIGFDANGIVGTGQSFKPSVMKNAQQNGITIVNNIDDLMKTLRPGNR